jgi:hypothetical protein
MQKDVSKILQSRLPQHVKIISWICRRRTGLHRGIYVSEKVSEWEVELKKLTAIAISQPQAAYSTLVYSLKNK